MNHNPLAEMLGAAATFIHPCPRSLGSVVRHETRRTTYRWQKALQHRTCWYRRMLHHLVEFKSAVAKYPTRRAPSDHEQEHYSRAVHRLIHYSGLSALYAGPPTHAAVWDLRFALEEIEGLKQLIEPATELEAALNVTQRAIDHVCGEGRALIGIPSLPSSATE